MIMRLLLGESSHPPAETGVINVVVTYTVESGDGWFSSAGRGMSANELHILSFVYHGRRAVPRWLLVQPA